MSAALYYWRATGRRSRRSAIVVALICGLLGTVVLGALAGARRTGTAYGRYLHAINSSDVFVNVPGAVLSAIRQVERLPGVASAAASVGLNANPVVNGKINDAFLTNGLTGSLDGDGFRQDRMTVLAGRLPRLDARDEVVLTQGQAKFFHTGVGGQVTYEFYRTNPTTNASVPAGRSTFLVTGIVDIPPVLGDQFDDVNSAVLPPAATARYLSGEFAFGWVGLRLTAGTAGIPALQRRLATLASSLDRLFHAAPGTIRLNIRRLDIVHQEVQQGIEPQALALAVLGALASLALLVLAGQGLAQLLARSAPDLAGLRALGASRAQAALAAGLAGAVAVLGGTALAVAGAVAVSPLAPVGAVRQFDPVRGVQADPLVLTGGGCALAAVLLTLLGVLAWRLARPPGDAPAARVSSVAVAAAGVGLPVTAVVGIREALDRGGGQRRAPVLATVIGSVVAVMAVAMAVVFGASLTGLVANPARYGWNWTLLMDTQGGYGSWPAAQMDRLVSGQPGVTGWSTFAFTQIPIDGQNVPVLGLTRYLGSVEPPTTSGHPITGPGQIELGVATLRQLGKRLGDTVTISSGQTRRTLTIVGTVTLPSIGLTIADHVSLGRGAMLADSTLLAAQGLSPESSFRQSVSSPVAVPAFPSAVAIDLARGTSGNALAARISHANPGGTPGGTYQLPLNRTHGAAIVEAAGMGSQPLALALAVAAGAVLSLALALLALVRQRRRELALLKALGLTRRQVMAAVAWQASVILGVAGLAGVPLGVAVGHWAWAAFATSLGAVPVTVVPLPALLAWFVVLVVTGNLLAAGPAAVAARTPPAVLLRAE
ncbi:MAG: FtsX-like permease family protein [Streptosporangiaceae bacterium]